MLPSFSPFIPSAVFLGGSHFGQCCVSFVVSNVTSIFFFMLLRTSWLCVNLNITRHRSKTKQRQEKEKGSDRCVHACMHGKIKRKKKSANGVILDHVLTNNKQQPGKEREKGGSPLLYFSPFPFHFSHNTWACLISIFPPC